MSTDKARRSSQILMRHFKAACALNEETIETAAQNINYSSGFSVDRILKYDYPHGNYPQAMKIIDYIYDAFVNNTPADYNYLKYFLRGHIEVLFTYKQQFRKKKIV